MKKIILLSLLQILFSGSLLYAQDNFAYNGKTIEQINITTQRIAPEIVKNKFIMHEGEVFFEENYDIARQSLHDMRVFKSIDFNLSENENGSISINIDAKDGYYVFPLIFGTGGSKSTFAAALIEANLFKAGEMVFLFGSFSSDGYIAMTGFGLSNNFFNIAFSGMKYTEYVYKNASYSTSGMFTAEPDEDKLGKPANKYDVKNNAFGLSWSRSFYEKVGITAGFSTAGIEYSGDYTPNDKGTHNKIILGLRSYKNMSPGSGGGGGMGSMFGIGLSDIADKLADLQNSKLGYFAGLTYENGGDLTGSDFGISKTNLKLVGNMEFKKRHVLFIDFAASKAFEAPFFDKIKSKDVLSGKGIYSREFRGDEAAGAGLSFVWFPVKNKTGVLSFVPFIENAIIWNNGSPQNHAGAGASISYQMWRIPFPVGLNYTQNLNDGSSDVSFVFGGGF
jgi:hypothetical protein